MTQADVEKLRGLGDPIDLAEVDAVYRPLTALLEDYIATSRERAHRTGAFLGVNEPPTPFVVAVAGSVAVGKSTTARLIAHLLARFPDTPRVDLVTTDGFLLPNRVLEKRGLMARKGFPESYDRRALLDFVAAVKSGSERIQAPVYSHTVYDIVPGRHIVVEQPDILVLRTEHTLSSDILRKVALFCNVSAESVVQSVDVPTIYQVPLALGEQHLDEIVLKKSGITPEAKPELKEWKKFLALREEAKDFVTIALVGKYVELQDAYKSIDEALLQAATYSGRKLRLISVHSEKVSEENVAELLGDVDGVVVAPGFGSRGVDGKFVALRYTREHGIPTLGICLGMQCMVIEFARNVLGWSDAHTTEIDPTTTHKVVDLMEEQKSISDLGGSMRLGGYDCVLRPGSKIAAAYGSDFIRERHRHRFEFNSQYREAYEAAGMICAGENPDTGLVETVELSGHPWYVGVQYHPEYRSTVLHPSPLFLAFVKEAIKHGGERHQA